MTVRSFACGGENRWRASSSPIKLTQVNLTVEEIADPFVDGAPHPHLAQVVDLWRRWSEAHAGHDDFQLGPIALAHELTDSPAVHTRLWQARRGEQVVGSLQLELPRHDNHHLADLEPCIDPATDAEPVLDALWEAVRPVLAAERRTSATTWAPSPLHGDGPALTPATGSGEIRVDPLARWLLDHGFVLDQVERAGLLRLPDDLPDLDALTAQARSYAAAYEPRCWTGITPEELRGGLAVLRGRMSTDVPMGDLPMDAERWDAARVLERDQRHLDAGVDDLWAVAIHRDSGQPVAHTYLSVPAEKPWVAWQEDTLVRPDHRGHRLGLLVKVANLAQLRRTHPGVRRVRTWNAHENSHMLAVNETLGFRTDSYEGCWVRND